VRDIIFACVLAAACLMVTFGVAYYTAGLGLVVGGVLLAGLGFLLLGDVAEDR